MVVNGYAEMAWRDGDAQSDDVTRRDEVARHEETACDDAATCDDTVLCYVASLEQDRAASYDDYMPCPAYPIDDIPLVPEPLEAAMQQGYRPRYEALNEDQRRAFRSLVEMACAITPSTTILGMDRSDAYLAWCALRRDFPEFYWLSSLHLDMEAEGTVARATYQEPFARRGRPHLLLDLSVNTLLTDAVLAELFCSSEDDAQPDAAQPDAVQSDDAQADDVQSGDAQAGNAQPGDTQDQARNLPSVEERVRRIHRRLLRGSVILRGNLPHRCFESVREHDRVLSEWTALDMKYLCDRCGVDCQVVWGTRRGFSHAWNMVRVDGRWLHVDAFADRELAEAYLAAHDDPDGVQSIFLEDGSLSVSALEALEERVPDMTVYLLRTNEEMSMTYDWSLAGLLPYL